MNEKDLLQLFQGTRDRYVLEAVESRSAVRPKLRSRRIMLIAAVIALALLLVGCVAVFLRLQDLSIGQETYTQKLDDEGHYMPQPAEKVRDVMAFYGGADSPIQQAMAEWYAFDRDYDPDGAIAKENDKNSQNIPAAYWTTYSCSSWEEVAKIDEIAQKYDLKLLDAWVAIQRYQSGPVLEALGMGNLLEPGAPVEVEGIAGVLLPPRNLELEFTLRLTGENAPWTGDVLASYEYARKDYLPNYGYWHMDLSRYQQWDYTAPDGTRLLLALDSAGAGHILADMAEHTIHISLDSNRTGSNFPDAEDVMGKAALEAFADAFDYRLEVPVIDPAALQPILDETEKEEQERLAARVQYHGSFAEYLQIRPLMNDQYYCFRDLDGDGAEELLLSSTQTGFHRVLTLWEGKVREQLWMADVHLLEGGGLLIREMPGDPAVWEFYEPRANGCSVQFGGEMVFGERGNFIEGLTCRDGVWKRGDDWYPEDYTQVISEAQAQEILAKYKEIPLPWTPLTEFPLDAEGRTLGDYWEESDVRLPREELLKAYADYAAQENQEITHYSLYDLNGDGVEDLLLSRDGETYSWAETHRYGQVRVLVSFLTYPCENGFLEYQQSTTGSDGQDIRFWDYYQLQGMRTASHLSIHQDQASGIWRIERNQAYEEITEAEAHAIQAQHPRLKLEMHPIAELWG